jgi:hypothetical protein
MALPTETIIALVSLVVGFPPTLLIIWHIIQRFTRGPGASDSSDVEMGKFFYHE